MGLVESQVLLWDTQGDPYDITVFNSEGDDLNNPIPSKELALDVVSDHQRWQDVGFIQFLSVASETLDDLSDGGSLLANGDVNAEKLLLVRRE